MLSNNEIMAALSRVRDYEYKNIYLDDEKYISFFERLVKSCQCKYISKLSKSTQILYQLAKIVGFDNIFLGYNKKPNLKEEMEKIRQLSYSKENRPIRIIIANDNRLWADNTFWALAYMDRIGVNIKLKDIPFYIVDTTKKVPSIISVNGSVIENQEDIKIAIGYSLRINELLDEGWRSIDISYTIEDLFNEIFY